MNKIQKLIFLIIILSAPVAGQEQPHRTWVGGGFTFTKSTAEDSSRIIAGAYVDVAYDLRHGFQVRGIGEYRSRPAIPRLFTGDEPLQATSELKYDGALVYHLPIEGRVRPLIGSGVSAGRQFFDLNASTVAKLPPGYSFYDSSVNPYVVIGAGLGRHNEFTFTRYIRDTYSSSALRGYGIDFANRRRLAGRLHIRSGLRLKFWSYRQGGESNNQYSREFSFFVGFHFQ